jgi:GntR family transcriptional repressor for pyruvate dehydrogenase complex
VAPDEASTTRTLLRPVRSVRLYERLVDGLVEYCEEAGLTVGDRLPAERDLAEGLEVSRASLRQAIVALEVQGVLEVRRGDGTYLRRPVRSGEPLASILARQQRLPFILEARSALEVKIVELAAQRRGSDDLKAMAAAIALAERELAQHPDEPPPTKPGQLFHQAIVRAARNPVLAALMEEMREPIAETSREALSQPNRWPRLIEEHQQIADHIRAKDSAAAATAMRSHLDDIADVRLLKWQVPTDL